MKTTYRIVTRPVRQAIQDMVHEGAKFLWHQYDSSECRDWEIAADSAGLCFITFTTHYDDTDSPEIGYCLRKSLEGFWRSRKFKFFEIKD